MDPLVLIIVLANSVQNAMVGDDNTLLGGLVAAGSHVIAIVTNARRYAGPALADWAPALGWVPWFVVAVVGAVGIATATLLSATARSWDDETNLTPTNSSAAR